MSDFALDDVVVQKGVECWGFCGTGSPVQHQGQRLPVRAGRGRHNMLLSITAFLSMEKTPSHLSWRSEGEAAPCTATVRARRRGLLVSEPPWYLRRPPLLCCSPLLLSGVRAAGEGTCWLQHCSSVWLSRNDRHFFLCLVYSCQEAGGLGRKTCAGCEGLAYCLQWVSVNEQEKQPEVIALPPVHVWDFPSHRITCFIIVLYMIVVINKRISAQVTYNLYAASAINTCAAFFAMMCYIFHRISMNSLTRSWQLQGVLQD